MSNEIQNEEYFGGVGAFDVGIANFQESSMPKKNSKEEDDLVLRYHSLLMEGKKREAEALVLDYSHGRTQILFRAIDVLHRDLEKNIRRHNFLEEIKDFLQSNFVSQIDATIKVVGGISPVLYLLEISKPLEDLSKRLRTDFKQDEVLESRIWDLMTDMTEDIAGHLVILFLLGKAENSLALKFLQSSTEKLYQALGKYFENEK